MNINQILSHAHILLKKAKIKTRLDRLRILGEVGDTSIHVKHTPDRKLINLLKDKKEIDTNLEKKCPLCLLSQSEKMIYPINLVRSLLWRGYIITANTYPYFKNHTLILSSNHNHNKYKIKGTQNILHHNTKMEN